MNQQLLDILNLLKHKHTFPPRDNIRRIELLQRASQNSMATIALTKVYIESASAVLDEFAEVIIRNRASVGLADNEISEALHEAFTSVTNEARGCALSDIHSDGFKRYVLEECESKLPPLLENLQRKVRLKDLDLGNNMSSVQVFGGQIGNLIVGSVNQTELTATVAHVIKQGGSEAELGRAIQNLIGVIGKLDESHKSQQNELFDLLNGFLKQIDLSKENRSPSVIKLIWDRIVQLSQVSQEVERVVQTILPMLPALFGR